jgi:predicted aconitase
VKLTPEEEAMLSGRKGEAIAFGMKIITSWVNFTSGRVDPDFKFTWMGAAIRRLEMHLTSLEKPARMGAKVTSPRPPMSGEIFRWRLASGILSSENLCMEKASFMELFRRTCAPYF